MKSPGQVIKDIRKDFDLTQFDVVAGLNQIVTHDNYNQVMISRYENEACRDNPYRLEFILSHASLGSWEYRYAFESLEALR